MKKNLKVKKGVKVANWRLGRLKEFDKGFENNRIGFLFVSNSGLL